MLVSRVACLGQIRHQQAGYSGPLSRHLLAYHCMISSVHACDRDLLEMNVIAMFLEGSVDRVRDDWTELGLRYHPLHLSEDETAAEVIIVYRSIMSIPVL